MRGADANGIGIHLVRHFATAEIEALVPKVTRQADPELRAASLGMTYVSSPRTDRRDTLATMKYRVRYLGSRLIRYAMCGSVIFIDIDSWRPRRCLPR